MLVPHYNMNHRCYVSGRSTVQEQSVTILVRRYTNHGTPIIMASQKGQAKMRTAWAYVPEQQEQHVQSAVERVRPGMYELC